MGDTHRTLVLTVLVAGLVLVAASCGRSGFQYIENDDSTVFAKIPDEWELVSEGIVDFTLTGDDGQLSILPGDDTLPWRALFDAEPSPDGSVGFDRVLGAVEVQPVDRRLRTDINLESIFGFDPEDPGEDVTVLAQADIAQGDLNGMRVIYQTVVQGVATTIDRQILTDDRFTTVYELRLGCDRDCFSANAEVIDEIMETFTVEVG
ncbi:MAG: hypothetical protein AAF480_15905 [Actinomycetota bacterium]